MNSEFNFFEELSKKAQTLADCASFDAEHPNYDPMGICIMKAFDELILLVAKNIHKDYLRNSSDAFHNVLDAKDLT